MSKPRLAIVGAGIIGLAHAWAAAKRGYAVTVFERDSMAVGASVRNFGLGLVLGQPPGLLFDLALRSRELWLELLPQLGSWHKAKGSMVVARNATELDVLQAFQVEFGAAYATQLLDADALAALGLRGVAALASPHEIALDARQTLPMFAHWLAVAHDVKFHFNTQVNAIALPAISTSRGEYAADQVLICSGHDTQTLFPAAYAGLHIQRCGLQMMRVANPGIQLGPALMTGLSTLHYGSFSRAPALEPSLDALRAQIQRDNPALLEHGIHLIVQQVGNAGDLIIGDSHHYGDTVAPFDTAEVEQLILAEAEALMQRRLTVRERWQGVYASSKWPFEVFSPAPYVSAVVITSGVGMSIGLALADQLMARDALR